MKKSIVTGLMLTLLLVGCGNDKSVFVENTSQDVELLYNSDTDDSMVDAVKIDTSSDGDNSDAINILMAADPKNNANLLHFDEKLKPGSFDESDYKLVVDEIEINLGEDFLEKQEKVGKARIEKSKACLESGYDIDYFYNNDKLVVYTVVKDSKQIVFNIEIRDDKCTTSKGAKIGETTKDNIYEMYGMPSDHSGKIFKYILSDKKFSLEFSFDENGILDGIDYVDNSIS